ncbi:MAG: SAM-dependent methyltransferase [Ruminococcaceae bacterium]|nr:SAM-dependent methyltransferase [Oscillospiraceae bacterium]
MTDKLTLDMRLATVAELVPSGAVFLDVGTDHGYLPARLLLDGKITEAGASDINADPLSKAVRTAEKYGVKDRMSFYLSDGLDLVPDLQRYNCISICGMGGELIARILSDSEYVRSDGVKLVLQPMSSAEELSVYLAENGFSITDERIAFAQGKLYRVIAAVYDGVRRTYTVLEHILGRINIEKGVSQPYFDMFLLKNILKYRRVCDGKRMGGIDAAAENEVLGELYRIAEKEGVEFENDANVNRT